MNFGNAFSPFGAVRAGSVLRNGINWSGILSNAQKTLGVINQAIPVFYQIRPMFNNIKTMFRVFNEINKDDAPKASTDETQTNISRSDNSVKYEQANYNTSEGPNFFI